MHTRSKVLIPIALAALLAPGAGAPGAVAVAGQRGGGNVTTVGLHYDLIDVGTFGGDVSLLNGPAVNIPRPGSVLGSAATTIPDADYPEFNVFGSLDLNLLHAFDWSGGRLHDLGALPGNNSSFVFEENRYGVGAGMSETGAFDSANNYPAGHAVVFDHGQVRDLGTLPGGQESQAMAINDGGQVAGFADNGTKDPYSMLGYAGQSRAFVWRNGRMRDIGTLGGPDAVVVTENASGQVAGDSYTDGTPNASTGVPTGHPYLWTNGHMRDLGTLGGTQSATNWLNRRGEVVGFTSLAGDRVGHPFLWTGGHLLDLGSLGGSSGLAWYIDDGGDVVGWSSPAGDQTVHAFLWRDGVMTDLTGADDSQCTFAESVNRQAQVVGGSCSESAALLWDRGVEYDLDSLVGPTDVHLIEAAYINDNGQIAALGVLPNGDQHVFLLKPDRRHRSTTVAASRPATAQSSTMARCLEHLPAPAALTLSCLRRG